MRAEHAQNDLTLDCFHRILVARYRMGVLLLHDALDSETHWVSICHVKYTCALTSVSEEAIKTLMVYCQLIIPIAVVGCQDSKLLVSSGYCGSVCSGSYRI